MKRKRDQITLAITIALWVLVPFCLFVYLMVFGRYPF